ncbi:DNA repair protein recA homolog 2, mitochondrial-like isoform X6, partial [Fagus crenata]
MGFFTPSLVNSLRLNALGRPRLSSLLCSLHQSGSRDDITSTAMNICRLSTEDSWAMIPKEMCGTNVFDLVRPANFDFETDSQLLLDECMLMILISSLRLATKKSNSVIAAV